MITLNVVERLSFACFLTELDNNPHVEQTEHLQHAQSITLIRLSVTQHRNSDHSIKNKTN